MKHIEKILLPVDFSSCSRDAYHVALDIAHRFDAALEVVHFYILPTETNEDESRNFILTEETFLENTQKRLEQFLYHDFTNSYEADIAKKIKIEAKIEIGFAGDQIVAYSKRPEIGLIIIGASGENPNLARLLGSIASEVASKAYCPVLLVPFGHRFALFENIIYASNEYSMNQDTLSYTFDWAKAFNAKIHFLNVKNTDKSFDNYSSTKMFNLVHQINPTNDVEVVYETVVDTLAWRGIYTYTDVEQANLVVLVTRHRNFFENLMHHSLTDDLSTDAHLPILILHADTQKNFS
jgi:nucleotide-binding universal stress UspA family protein